MRRVVKILIACNTLTSLHGEIYQNHVRFFYRLGKDHPKIEFHHIFARRLSIDRFRNFAIKTAMQIGVDYLMFIDDDMKMEVDCFTKLYQGCKEGGYHILAALNYIRGYPYKPMTFTYDEKVEGMKRLVNSSTVDSLIDETGDGILDCNAIGTAVCLIDMSILPKIPGPWFVTGPHSTEDIYFCLKAKECFPELKIGTHCGVITGHLLEPEVISYNTRQHLFKYEESYMSDEQIEMQRSGDRGDAYIRANVEPLLEKLHARQNQIAKTRSKVKSNKTKRQR